MSLSTNYIQEVDFSLKANIEKLNLKESQLPAQLPKTTFFQGLIEGFIDGVLILTQQGQWINANNNARKICHILASHSPKSNSIPEEIWEVCQTLKESRGFYPNQPVIIESEVRTQQLRALRIRARWLDLEAFNEPCLLVILEDRYQSMQRTVIAETKQYGLTPRESEVWLLRRLDYTFQAIADQLFISLNTVKKHMRNIRTKQEMANLLSPYQPTAVT
ncbi:MAG: LuxR C-terminal-related transcriptional regulator [Leptolyngbyaceae cyanobacterium MO_188.B28]|nr:LuxR C-terminal-related transcriptional regulator [Leptolyngbyaceae cyanobacterium MO_188.B28]